MYSSLLAIHCLPDTESLWGRCLLKQCAWKHTFFCNLDSALFTCFKVHVSYMCIYKFKQYIVSRKNITGKCLTKEAQSKSNSIKPAWSSRLTKRNWIVLQTFSSLICRNTNIVLHWVICIICTYFSPFLCGTFAYDHCCNPAFSLNESRINFNAANFIL